jgi:hypothetical protein
MLSGTMYGREARPHITKGGYYDLDDFCDSRNTLGAGFSHQLHNGRAHPHFARRGSHCAGGRSLSEAMTATNDLGINFRGFIYLRCNLMIAHLKAGGEK